MTDPQRAAIVEIAIIALLTGFIAAILLAWLYDIITTAKPSHDVLSANEGHMTETPRIDDMTECDAEYLLNDPWYRETLVELLDSLGDRKGETK